MTPEERFREIRTTSEIFSHKAMLRHLILRHLNETAVTARRVAIKDCLAIANDYSGQGVLIQAAIKKLLEAL